jgi:hypothetical protein
MSKTMLRIVAIVMIVLIVAFSGCVGDDKEPAEVEPTPATTPVTPVTPVTPAATPAVTPAVEETKTADAEEGFTPKTSDRQGLEVPSGGCEGLDQSVLRRYDHDKDGLIDDKEMETAKIGYESNYEKPSDYAQILYAYEHNCQVEQAE